MLSEIESIFAWVSKFLEGNWQTSFAALSGTFFGAYFAFLFERRHKELEKRNMNMAALKTAQFTIAVQLRGAKNIKSQVLDPKCEDQDRHLTILPFTVHAKFPKLDFQSLTFMLKGEGAQLLNELMLATHQFDTLVGALNERNIRHEEMQRRISVQGPEIGLDQATVIILKDMTDSIFGLGDDVVEELQSTFNRLRVYIEKSFPGTGALSIEILEE
jgi:hypothetical protein